MSTNIISIVTSNYYHHHQHHHGHRRPSPSSVAIIILVKPFSPPPSPAPHILPSNELPPPRPKLGIFFLQRETILKLEHWNKRCSSIWSL